MTISGFAFLQDRLLFSVRLLQRGEIEQICNKVLHSENLILDNSFEKRELC